MQATENRSLMMVAALSLAGERDSERYIIADPAGYVGDSEEHLALWRDTCSKFR
jgi:hypothetical protein